MEEEGCLREHLSGCLRHPVYKYGRWGCLRIMHISQTSITHYVKPNGDELSWTFPKQPSAFSIWAAQTSESAHRTFMTFWAYGVRSSCEMGSCSDLRGIKHENNGQLHSFPCVLAYEEVKTISPGRRWRLASYWPWNLPLGWIWKWVLIESGGFCRCLSVIQTSGSKMRVHRSQSQHC